MFNKSPRKWDNIMVLSRFAESFLLLDSGLRRNDGKPLPQMKKGG
jgi:hypothetical protein